MFKDTDDIGCVICLDISLTTTDCNHPLCKKCYKAIMNHPQENMRRCPCCRKDHIKLNADTIRLTEEQRAIHYQTLLEFYNDANVPPVTMEPIRFEYGLNRVVDKYGFELADACPFYDTNHVLVGTLGEIKDKSCNRTVVNKFGVQLGDVNTVVLFYDVKNVVHVGVQ